MVSCGYEPTAVIDGFGSLGGFWGMVRGSFRKYRDPHALELLKEAAQHGTEALAHAGEPSRSLEETRA